MDRNNLLEKIKETFENVTEAKEIPCKCYEFTTKDKECPIGVLLLEDYENNYFVEIRYASQSRLLGRSYETVELALKMALIRFNESDSMKNTP